MKMIGTESFTVRRNGTKEGQYNQQLNCYTISTNKENFNEQLNLDENQVNELINLLEKVKEIL